MSDNLKNKDILDELVVGKRPDFSRRVLFLDFDGPINLGGHYTPPEGETRNIVHAWRGIPKSGAWANSIVNTIHLSYYEEIADLLRPLNCLWISSWKDLTQSKLNPLLDFDFGYLNWKYRGPSDWGMYGKMNSIAKVIRETGCDWLVVDDEIEVDALDYLTKDCGKKGHLICPNSFLGLSIDEMNEIRYLMA